MNPKSLLAALFLLFLPSLLSAQAAGAIYDAITKEAVPFASIRFANTGQGMVAGLDGKFELPASAAALPYIEISSLGYKLKKVTLPIHDTKIYLHADNNTLGEVTIKPPYDKMRRIINSAIANKPRNNPDKYDWYRCHVYYKMIVDAYFPEMEKDTSQDSKDMKEFFDNQHLLISETYSTRTWKQPQHLQEDIRASKFSGLKKPAFTSLVTDIQPFHAYNDYITLNGKDYHNPVSRGFEQYYKFNLSDEIMQGKDTVWVLSFTPNGNSINILSGKVYINSDGYAISQIVARGADSMLNINVRIEQQYEQVTVTDNEKRWFPAHLNYIIDWKVKLNNTSVTYHMKGNSKIDSVSWQEDKDFKFDKAHTVRTTEKGDQLTDAQWSALRPDTLDKKEASTYHVIDSIGARYKLDKIMSYLSKLPDSKVPVGPVDLDIRRIISSNKYEGIRLGLGAQTNEQVIKWLSVGGWFGYGFKDKEWKYGAFTEVYFDRYKEFTLRFGYDVDLSEPGRMHLNRELEKGYLKRLLLNRVDETREFTALLKKKLGYWNVELAGAKQEIIPIYNYVFAYNGIGHYTYTATEASLSFRYAYAERTVPYFGMYKRLNGKYPVLYGKITTGVVEGNSNMNIPYTQVLAAIQWKKHINRIGSERILLMGGMSWSNDALPLSKLFAGNGFRYDSKSNVGLYSFGGLMNIYPYEYYSDRFVHFIYRHDFDWKLFKIESRQSKQSVAPNIALQYNLLYGELDKPWVHQLTTPSIPDNGYNEAGIIINNLLRYRVFDLYYITLNMGYFAHITPTFDSKKDGRIVYGIGVEL